MKLITRIRHIVNKRVSSVSINHRWIDIEFGDKTVIRLKANLGPATDEPEAFLDAVQIKDLNYKDMMDMGVITKNEMSKLQQAQADLEKLETYIFSESVYDNNVEIQSLQELKEENERLSAQKIISPSANSSPQGSS